MILLVNPFTVDPDRIEAFLDLWDRSSAIFRAKPGYISTRLCAASAHQPPGISAPHTHVNVAEWRSAEDYAAALQDRALKRMGPEYARISTFRPALYDIVREVGAEPGRG